MAHLFELRQGSNDTRPEEVSVRMSIMEAICDHGAGICFNKGEKFIESLVQKNREDLRTVGQNISKYGMLKKESREVV